MDFVKRVIDEWDPIDLLFHAPDDEYHSEIEEIRHLLSETGDFANLADGIYNVFVKSFGIDTFNKSKEECIQIAQTLLSQKNTATASPHFHINVRDVYPCPPENFDKGEKT